MVRKIPLFEASSIGVEGLIDFKPELLNELLG
jgi:hypothetical protein